MARMARVVAAGVPHHITQRGNNRQDIFLLDDDRRFYLDTLRERSQRYGVTLLGYCLMTNHVHLVAIPERPDSLARALGQSGMDPKSEASKEGTINQGTVRRFNCLEDDLRRSSSWRPSGGSRPVSRARP